MSMTNITLQPPLESCIDSWLEFETTTEKFTDDSIEPFVRVYPKGISKEVKNLLIWTILEKSQAVSLI